MRYFASGILLLFFTFFSPMSFADCETYRYSRIEIERNLLKFASCPKSVVCSGIIVCDEKPEVSFFATCQKVEGRCPSARRCLEWSNSRKGEVKYKTATPDTKAKILKGLGN